MGTLAGICLQYCDSWLCTRSKIRISSDFKFCGNERLEGRRCVVFSERGARLYLREALAAIPAGPVHWHCICLYVLRVAVALHIQTPYTPKAKKLTIRVDADMLYV